MSFGNTPESRGFGRRLLAACLVAFGLVPVGLLATATAASASPTATSLSFSTYTGATYFSGDYVAVTVKAASGPNPTSGTVTITDSFGDLSCTVTLSGSDQAGCQSPEADFTATGTDTISASYGGTSSYGSSSGSTSVSVAPASTTLSISASNATVGQTSTITARFTPPPADSSGTLTITDSAGAINCSTTSVSGGGFQCTSAVFTAVATDSITASWTGNTNYNSASASTVLDVGQASTVVASVTAAPTQVGQTGTISVQVQPHPDAGYVQVTDADGQVTTCSDAAVSASTGIATCTTGPLTTADASDTLSAKYLGDANYAASATTTGTLDVQRGTTQVAVTASPTPSVGSTATYVATVSPNNASSGGGSVGFTDTAGKVTDCSNQQLSSTTSSGSCTSLTYTSTGSDTVTGSFPGNANWAPSSSSSTFSVSQGSPNISVTVSPSSPTVGEKVTVTAVVSPTDGGGSVDFSGTYMGANCSAVALTGNSASCASQTLTSVGSWTLTATYSGDSNYSSAFGGKSISVAQAPTTVAVSASTPSPYAFASDTLSATVSPIPDGGTVNFTDTNGAIAGCSGIAVNTTTGIASCAIASLPGAGSYGVTASYSGDTNYVANSGQLTLAIAKIPTSITVTPLPNPVTVGQTTTLTIAISPVPDGGTVTVTDAYGDLTCSSVSVATSGQGAGTATCTTRALSPGGSDSLAASFTGSSNYTPATGSSAITVNRIASTTTVSSADAYGVVGQELHVSVQVSPVPSSGTVAFSDSLGELGVCGAVSVNPSTGVASCTSGALTKAGQDLVTATFQQSATEAASTVSTTIPVDQQPSFSGSLTLNETASSPSSAAVSVAGYPAPTVTAGAALPAGLTLNANGSISGTPAFGTGGVYDLPLTATNSLASASATATLVVGQAPAVTSATSLTAAYGTQTTFQVTTAAGTYPTASFALSGGTPAGMGFTDNHNGTATISGAPTNYVSGPQTFSLVVSNSVGSISVPYTIDVTGTPAPPSSGGGSTTGVVTTPNGGGSNTTTLSPFAQALSLHKSEAVPSAGTQPAIAESGALPATYDPIAPTRTIRKGKKKVSQAIVTLGQDSRFPTLGNVGPYGDCAVVADSSIVRVDHLVGKVKAVPSMTTNEALSEWSAINGGTGSGLTDSQLLHAWAGPGGLLGTRIRGWHLLATGNITALKRAIEASGALYAGILLPSSGDVGTTIDPAMTADTQVSGHALAIYGWTLQGFLGISWGEVVLLPYSWWSQFSTTAYAVNVIQPVVHHAKAPAKATTKKNATSNKKAA